MNSGTSTENTEMNWFVVHTYSGFEHKAKLALEERIKSLKKAPFLVKSLYLKKMLLN